MASEVIGVLLLGAMTVGLFAMITFTLAIPAEASDIECKADGPKAFTLKYCRKDVCQLEIGREVFAKCKAEAEKFRQESQSVSNELPCRLAKYDLRYCEPREEPGEENESDNLNRTQGLIPPVR